MSLGERPVLEHEVRNMSAAIVHRGPDEDGFHLEPYVGLGMRRLSIIDLKTGRQPISNEDGAIWVVFNGEIYNYRQLRADLEKRGHSFATTTDTETIVHLYEEYGEHAVDHLRGMFAFALWDRRNRRLLLVRDRLGIKPLYYAEVGGRLVFASELKAILQLPQVERKLNWTSVNHLFSSMFTPPSESIFEGIHKLEAGHILLATPAMRPRITPYWDVHFEPNRRRSEEETVEQLQVLLRESVKLHMVSDVPVGAFLSGGIDSSAVVAEMVPLSKERVRTFSIGFPEEDYNELRFARLMARRLGTEHHELVIEPDAVDILDSLAWHLDEPFGDPSAIPTYFVSRLAAQHGKVVLSGDGGDELFAGYDKYAVEQRERKRERIPAPIRRLLGDLGTMLPDGFKGRNFLRHIALSGAARCLDGSNLFRSDMKRRLFQPEPFRLLSANGASGPDPKVLARLDSADGDWLSVMQYLDLKRYLQLDILTKVDRMSMAHALEVRPPLLDHKLVEFAATIPPELQLRASIRKYTFKRALRGLLPDEIIDRPKRGFAIPLGRWFRGKLESFVHDLLLSPTALQRGIFQPEYIEHMLALHKKGKELDQQLWTLISFEMWARTYLDSASVDMPTRRVESGWIPERQAVQTT